MATLNRCIGFVNINTKEPFNNVAGIMTLQKPPSLFLLFFQNSSNESTIMVVFKFLCHFLKELLNVLFMS